MLLCALALPAAASVSVTEYALPSGCTSPGGMCRDINGNIWFPAGQYIVETQGGGTMSKTLVAGAVSPVDCCYNAGDDGIWMVDYGQSVIIDAPATGTATSYGTPGAHDGPLGIAADASGDLWVTLSSTNAIYEVTLAGDTMTYDLPAGATLRSSSVRTERCGSPRTAPTRSGASPPAARSPTIPSAPPPPPMGSPSGLTGRCGSPTPPIAGSAAWRWTAPIPTSRP
jgi:hypothetical protein